MKYYVAYAEDGTVVEVTGTEAVFEELEEAVDFIAFKCRDIEDELYIEAIDENGQQAAQYNTNGEEI